MEHNIDKILRIFQNRKFVIGFLWIIIDNIIVDFLKIYLQRLKVYIFMISAKFQSDFVRSSVVNTLYSEYSLF